MGKNVASWVELGGSQETASGFENPDEVQQAYYLNEKQAHAADILRLQAQNLDAHCEQRNRLAGGGALSESEDSLTAPPALSSPSQSTITTGFNTSRLTLSSSTIGKLSHYEASYRLLQSKLRTTKARRVAYVRLHVSERRSLSNPCLLLRTTKAKGSR